MSNIAKQLAYIQERIDQAAAGSDVHLVAVSKKQSTERLGAALDAGHRLFGESRVQEAREHWLERRLAYPDLSLHLIGPLQTNKVKEAVSLFDVIETVDRHKLARKLADEMAMQAKDLPCFIQVNIGEETQKSGVFPSELPDFYQYCYGECGLDIKGLMCIPPASEDPVPYFKQLASLAKELGVPYLSMGMSADFEDAIACGATHVRVGSALFGARES